MSHPAGVEAAARCELFLSRLCRIDLPAEPPAEGGGGRGWGWGVGVGVGEAGEGHLERYLLCDPHRGIAVGGKGPSSGDGGGGQGVEGMGEGLLHAYRM